MRVAGPLFPNFFPGLVAAPLLPTRSPGTFHLRSNSPAIDECLGSGWKESLMGRGILLWLLGVPIPVIILILLFWR